MNILTDIGSCFVSDCPHTISLIASLFQVILHFRYWQWVAFAHSEEADPLGFFIIFVCALQRMAMVTRIGWSVWFAWYKASLAIFSARIFRLASHFTGGRVSILVSCYMYGLYEHTTVWVEKFLFLQSRAAYSCWSVLWFIPPYYSLVLSHLPLDHCIVIHYVKKFQGNLGLVWMSITTQEYKGGEVWCWLQPNWGQLVSMCRDHS